MTEKEFEKTVRDYSDMVYRISLNILRDPEDSQDAMQNVFLRYLRKGDGLKSEEHRKAWLIRVAINESRRLLSSKNKCDCVCIESVAPSPGFEDEASEDLFTEVMKLPQKYRTVIYLYYYEGYSVKEIAGILRITSATVRTRLSRARESLRTILKEDYYD